MPQLHYQLTVDEAARSRLRALVALQREEGLYAVRTSLSQLRRHGTALLERQDLDGDVDERELWSVTVSDEGALLLERGEMTDGALCVELHLDDLAEGVVQFVAGSSWGA